MLKLKTKYIGYKIAIGSSVIELKKDMNQKDLNRIKKLNSKFVTEIKEKSNTENDKDTEIIE